MRRSYCYNCDHFDDNENYCTLHGDNIRYIDDCDDFYDSDEIIDYMFGEDGPDDGYVWGN